MSDVQARTAPQNHLRALVRRKAGNSGCMLTKVNITSAPQNLSKLDIRASDNSTVNGQVSKLVSSKSPIPTEQERPRFVVLDDTYTAALEASQQFNKVDV